MNVQNLYSENLPALTSGGVVVVPDRNNATPANRGLTLTAATFFIPLNVADESTLHLTLKWNAAFAGTITVETTDFPATLPVAGGLADDVTDYSTTAGDWEQENPTTAYVSTSGTGNSATNLTITAGGTNAGGASFHIGNFGAKRIRLRIVCSTGGILRVGCNSKRPGETG